MLKNTKKNEERIRRHKRVRKVVNGTPDCPRLNVFRSNANIYAQVIDDTTGNIDSVRLDRGGYVYHGRVQALADAAREAGLKF